MKKIALVLLAAISCSSLIACTNHYHKLHGSSEMMSKMAAKHLDKILTGIDASDTQRERIEEITALMAADAKKIRSSTEDRQLFFAKIMAEEPDRAWLHAKLDEKAQLWTAFGHNSLDRLLEINALLTAEQRKELMEKYQAAHGGKK